MVVGNIFFCLGLTRVCLLCYTVGASEEHFLLGSFRVFSPGSHDSLWRKVVWSLRVIYLAFYVDRHPDCLSMVRGLTYFYGKPKKGNFSYFGSWFLGCENRVFVRGWLFGWGVFGVVCVLVYRGFCFGYIIVFLLGCFGWFPASFILCLRTKIFVVVLADYFVCPPPPSCFMRLVFVLFCCVLYGVLCMCCVRFVYLLSRTWLAPVQRCMYDTCYMSVLSHKTMQKCEKMHNKTLQTTTSVHFN